MPAHSMTAGPAMTRKAAPGFRGSGGPAARRARGRGPEVVPVLAGRAAKGA
jgi:hypothetical protein